MSKNSETYTSSPLGGGSKPKRKGSYIGTMFFIVHLALTISLSVALIIAYLTRYISPEYYGALTIVGHFRHILYILVLACLMVWIIARRWKFSFAVFLVLIPGLFHVSEFFNINWVRDTEVESQPKDAFTVVSYNVRGFRNDDGHRVVKEYADYLAVSNPFVKNQRAADVICLQEYALDADNLDYIDLLITENYKNIYINDVNESENVILRTYSRYPIVASGSIADTGRGTSQWVDIVMADKDTIRVFNNHFYTMGITEEDSEDISRGKILSDRDNMMSIVDRVAENTSVRINHVDSLRQVISATPYRHIVCGDFNDTPGSYVYKQMTDNLNDIFTQKGSGFGYTYRPMWGWLRIDYVLYSEGLEPLNYNANNEVELSDHLPVAAQFKFVEI
ncbi:MAG: endonuclease/exonuclease/phosphatase family protein [Alistipes sp.]|nr:endonuclease/exonuclease/phosphatase family protein [Alistipes sp.]